MMSGMKVRLRVATRTRSKPFKWGFGSEWEKFQTWPVCDRCLKLHLRGFSRPDGRREKKAERLPGFPPFSFPSFRTFCLERKQHGAATTFKT